MKRVRERLQRIRRPRPQCVHQLALPTHDGKISVEFKPFGVGLGFTPVVLSEGRISLKISTEVSEITGENAFVSQGGLSVDSDGTGGSPAVVLV